MKSMPGRAMILNVTQTHPGALTLSLRTHPQPPHSQGATLQHKEDFESFGYDRSLFVHSLCFPNGNAVVVREAAPLNTRSIKLID